MTKSNSDEWNPEVGERRRVTLEVNADNEATVVDPPLAKPVEVRGTFEHPSGTRLKAELKIVDRSGITRVIAEPTGRVQRAQPETGASSGPDRWELIEALRRLAADVGRTPTLDHVEDHGEYQPENYREEFDSFLVALEEAGLEPTQAQYNFSNYEAPEHMQDTQNVRYLREHGPAPTASLPGGISMQDKQHGAAKFLINTNVNTANAVYYLMDEHDEEAVIRAFLEANPHVVENNSRRTLVSEAGNHSSAFRSAMRKVIDEYLASDT